jgi:hypothetical protein
LHAEVRSLLAEAAHDAVTVAFFVVLLALIGDAGGHVLPFASTMTRGKATPLRPTPSVQAGRALNHGSRFANFEYFEKACQTQVHESRSQAR